MLKFKLFGYIITIHMTIHQEGKTRQLYPVLPSPDLKEQVLSKLPDFKQEWPVAAQLSWLEAFERLWNMTMENKGRASDNDSNQVEGAFLE